MPYGLQLASTNSGVRRPSPKTREGTGIRSGAHHFILLSSSLLMIYALIPGL